MRSSGGCKSGHNMDTALENIVAGGRTAKEKQFAGAQAIRRSVAIIRTVAQLQRSGATASRVAHALALSRPTVFRILRSLAEERMLLFDEENRSYWVGPLVYELGLAAAPDGPMPHEWGAVVRQVAERTRLTSYLIGRSGNEAVCLLCVQGAATIRAMPVEAGQRVPLGIGAGSLAILASLEDDEIHRIISAGAGRLEPFPGKNLSPDELLEAVARTRQKGYSVSSGTVARGVSGVGVLVPIRDRQLPLAVTVSAVASMLPEQEVARLASTIAKAIREHEA